MRLYDDIPYAPTNPQELKDLRVNSTDAAMRGLRERYTRGEIRRPAPTLITNAMAFWSFVIVGAIVAFLIGFFFGVWQGL